MKYILLALALFSTNSTAADYGYKNKDYGYKNKDYGYESSAGRKYQYDSNSPSDSIRYESDFRAQQRDSNSQFKRDSYKDIIEDAYGDRGRGKGLLDD